MNRVVRSILVNLGYSHRLHRRDCLGVERRQRRKANWGLKFSPLRLTPLFSATVMAQANLTWSSEVQGTCVSPPTLTMQFHQPATPNVYSLQFDLRFLNRQFQSVFSNDSSPDNDKPIIKKLNGLVLPDHSVDARLIPEGDPGTDGNPGTSEWRIIIVDANQPFALAPEGSLLSLQFFPAATAANGANAIEILSILGSDEFGSEINTLTGLNGRITLSGCATPNRLSLPLIMKQ